MGVDLDMLHNQQATAFCMHLALPIPTSKKNVESLPQGLVMIYLFSIILITPVI